MLKIKNDEKGFTLLEIMVSIMIIGIVLTALSSSFISGFKFFQISKNQAHTQRDIRFIANYIMDSVKYTNSIQLKADIPEPENLSESQSCIALDGSSIKLITNSGERTLTSINIDNLSFKLNPDGDKDTESDTINDILEFTISGGYGEQRYEISSSVLLNNIKDIKDEPATTTPQKVILFNK